MAPTAPTKPSSKPATTTTATSKPPQRTLVEFYHSSSTGHQVGHGVSKPVSWHKARESKLNQQLKKSNISSSEFLSLLETSSEPTITSSSRSKNLPADSTINTTTTPTAEDANKKLFEGCSIYISGMTQPHIGDHALKHLLGKSGAQVSTYIRATKNTHIIIGEEAKVGSGAGGGLAAGKIQKLVQSRKLVGMKFVSVHWVLDSVKAGRRLPEGRYKVDVLRSRSQKTL